MIWLTWRQFRIQAVVAAVFLVAAVVALTVDAHLLSGIWASTGAARCPATGDCAALKAFSTATSHGLVTVLFVLDTALLYLVPPVIGLFWGAPLVARELEAGTHRLVWNQSATRTRWLATKLAVLGGGSMVLAGVLGLGVWWASARLDVHVLSRIGPLLFGARGVVPIAYAAFAFVLGVVAGMVIRRTVPAMAVTLGAYVGVLGVMILGVRAHLVPLRHLTQALNVRSLDNLTIGQNGEVHVTAKPDVSGAWILSNRTLAPDGAEFVGTANPACSPSGSPKACEAWVDSLGLRTAVVYQPASHFWPLQWAEFGVFAALTAALIALGFWWLRHRTA
jgi:ABC-type transport system involved in multi-copper enzyme maturation permease subunit